MHGWGVLGCCFAPLAKTAQKWRKHSPKGQVWAVFGALAPADERSVMGGRNRAASWLKPAAGALGGGFAAAKNGEGVPVARLTHQARQAAGEAAGVAQAFRLPGLQPGG